MQYYRTFCTELANTTVCSFKKSDGPFLGKEGVHSTNIINCIFFENFLAFVFQTIVTPTLPKRGVAKILLIMMYILQSRGQMRLTARSSATWTITAFTIPLIQEITFVISEIKLQKINGKKMLMHSRDPLVVLWKVYFFKHFEKLQVLAE